MVKPKANGTSILKTVSLRTIKLELTIYLFSRDYHQTAERGSLSSAWQQICLNSLPWKVSCLIKIKVEQETDCLAIPWLLQINQPSKQRSWSGIRGGRVNAPPNSQSLLCIYFPGTCTWGEGGSRDASGTLTCGGLQAGHRKPAWCWLHIPPQQLVDLSITHRSCKDGKREILAAGWRQRGTRYREKQHEKHVLLLQRQKGETVSKAEQPSVPLAAAFES